MNEKIEYRKLQRVGRGSYIVTLPKDWVQDQKLEKGAHLAIRREDDSSLLVVPREVWEGKKEESRPREYMIYADSRVDSQSLCRKIASLYVVSADIIHIKFKEDKIPPEHRSAVNKLTKGSLLGSEVISERDGEIVIQILVSHSDFPLERAIRRMSLLALSAKSDIILALKDMNEELIREITELCNDVNRLNLYVIRQLKYGLDRDLSEEFGFESRREFLGYRIVANAIKSIADNALNIVKNLKGLREGREEQTLRGKGEINSEIISQLLEFNSKVRQFFEEALKALFSRKYLLADKLLSDIEKLANLENELATTIASQKIDPGVSAIFRLILDSSRRIVQYGRSIAEVTLNRTVEEEVKRV
ncbi:MAG: PhoU domain-containing protein [Thermoproteota archaeon]